ncbi:Protein ANTAGONIST OF LIKE HETEROCHROMATIN PROTEIN 1 [Frankliniella fusca]|uniref:Protein ANTAGONIST OF LIKE HETEROCHROMATIN PROTEIN 1 n=1 Tax=Frankliniella fusca TaxID=407009 RepID=A0AAE1HSG1_9NEOP|nr:Protein ANTAGONIST OF LIKE HETEROCHROMATIN PROTEIN 1 [Frankliniella fusca]
MSNMTYYLEWQRRRRRRKALALFSFIIVHELWRRTPDRRIWVQPWVARRDMLGIHNNLFLELRRENPEKYRRCLRMTPEMFDWLANKVDPIIRKQDTHLRRSISVEQRLSITLRHLATGETQESLSCQFRVGQSTISGIIKETCKAIYDAIICLHNLLRTDVVGRAMYTPPEMLDKDDELTGTVQMGQWRDVTGNGLVNLQHQGGNRHGRHALALRERWTEYFNGPGAVPWQDRMVSI